MFSAIKEVKELFKKSKGIERDKEPAKPNMDYVISCLDGGKKHDWQEVSSELTQNIIERIDGVVSAEQSTIRSSPHLFYVNYKSGPSQIISNQFKIRVTTWAVRTVCLDCGLCIDGVKKVKESVEQQIKNQIEILEKITKRDLLAKKLWKACEGGVK